MSMSLIAKGGGMNRALAGGGGWDSILEEPLLHRGGEPVFVKEGQKLQRLRNRTRKNQKLI